MKNLLIAMTFILTFSFCQSKEKTTKETEKEPIFNLSQHHNSRKPLFRLSDHYDKFRFHDSKEFGFDSLNTNEIRKRFLPLDSLEITQIIQGDEHLRMNGTYFYYSTFSDPTLIAILREPFDQCGAHIQLLKYDTNGKLKNNTFISGGCSGCFGDYSYSKGKLIEDTSFIITHVYINPIYNNKNKNTTTLRDSSILKIRFGINDEIKTDTLLNKRDTIFLSKSN